MRGSAQVKISTNDALGERETPFSSLWVGPSSPSFNHLQSADKSADSVASTPSTPSEFEFASISSLEIKDDSALSPKFIATGYWGTTICSCHGCTPVSEPAIAPLSPSPSVRQLIAEETHGESDDDFNLDFYSAPQTPLRTPPRRSAPTASEQWSLSREEPSLSTHIGRRRKSNSAVLDRGTAVTTTQKNQVLEGSKSEPNTQCACVWEEEGSGVKKQASKSCKKWAFKDLLRRTVPSSKAETRYINKTMGASSSRKFFSSTKSNPSTKPLASPTIMHSTSMPKLHTSHQSTPASQGQCPVSGSSTPARSPPHQSQSSARSSAQTQSRTPMPFPPRSPLSPHAIHYQQNKAQSLELTRRTFLPYRQSLLGCLGGPGSFPFEQQA